MYRVIAAFLQEIQRLDDCHRICETMNFLDEYDGGWHEAPEDRAREIVRRLPTKVGVEARLMMRCVALFDGAACVL